MKILRKLLLLQNIESKSNLISLAGYPIQPGIDFKKRKRFALPLLKPVIFASKPLFFLLTIFFTIGSLKTYAQGPSFTYSTPNTFTYGSAVSLSPSVTSSTPPVTWSIDNLPAGLTFDTGTGIISGTPTAISPATDYIVTATDGNGSNTFVVNIAVNPAPLTITANSQSKTYGTTFSFAGTEFTASGLVNSDAVSSVTLTSAGSAAAATVAGSPYSIVPSAAVGSGLSNYTITYANGSMTVNMATLTITAKSQSKTYGTTFSFVGTEFTASGLVNSDAVSSVTLTSAGSATTAAVAGSPYTIVPSAAAGSGLSNYTITYVNGSMTVNTAALTITANAQNKTYGTTFSFAGTEFTASGLVNSDAVSSVTLTSTGSAATATVAGSPYSIVPSAAVGSGLSNYTITYANGSMTVNPATLTITAKSQSKTYGTTFSFAGTEFTASGLVNSDGVTSVTLTSTGSPATATVAGSPYSIVPSAAVGSGLSNYTITYANGPMTVNTATLTITAKPISKAYNTTYTFAGTEFTTSGLVNSDAVSSVTLTSTGSPATATVAGSPYPIIPSAAVGTGLSNYTITYVNGSMTVTSQTLTITAKSQSKTYGTPFTFAGTEFTVTGLVGSDNVSSVTLTSAGSAATATVAGSPYSIVPSAAVGSGLSNYTIVYVNGSMTVTAKTLTLTSPKAANKTYDGTTAATITGTLSGVLAADAANVTLVGTGTFASANVGTGIAVTGTCTLSGTAASNYTLTQPTGLTANITAAVLTITGLTTNPASGKTYDGTTAAPLKGTATLVGVIGTDNVTLLGSPTGTYATANVGNSITITITGYSLGGSAAGNYTLATPLTITGKIIAATLTITPTPLSKVYGTIEPASVTGQTTFTAVGLQNGETIGTVTINYGNQALLAREQVGTYSTNANYSTTASAATGGTFNPNNYNITYATGTFTVTPAPFYWVGGTSSNWRTTANWYSAGLIQDWNYPGKTSSADVVYIAVSGGPTGTPSTVTTPTVVLDSTLTVASITIANSGSSTISLSPNPGITLATSGGFTLNSGTLAVTVNTSGTLNIGGNYTASSSGNTFTKSGTGTMTITGTTTNTGTFNQSGTGLVTMTGATSNTGTINQTSTGGMTFTGDFTNSGSTSVFKQTGSGTATFSGALTNQGAFTQSSGAITVVGTLTNSATGTLTLGSGDFTMSSGDYINSGTFTAGTGNVFFTNTLGTQKLYGGSGTGTVFNNVTFNSTKGPIKMMTGVFGISSTGIMSLAGSGTTADVNSSASLTLYSTASGSATVSAIPTGCSMTGNVSVQRYIPGGLAAERSYRLLSPSVWTATNTTSGNHIYSISYLLNSTYISGTAFPSTTTNSHSKTGNPSLYIFRENMVPSYSTFLNSCYRGIESLSYDPYYLINLDSDTTGTKYDIPVGNGYLFFFRGGTGTVNPFVSGSTPAAATLSISGTLNQGTISVNQWYNESKGKTGLLYSTISGDPTIEGLNLVGNPYPSTIDWNNFSSTNSAAPIYGPNITGEIVLLNPNSQDGGNYGHYLPAIKMGTNNATNLIGSGVGFMVYATKAGATLTFTESAKTNTQASGAALFMANKRSLATETKQYIRMQMRRDSINTDETLIYFSPNSSAGYVAGEDASYKFGTGQVNMSSLSSDNTLLAINQLPLGQNGNMIKLHVGATADGNYSLKTESITGIPQKFDVWLKDAVTKDSINLRNSDTYNFTITGSDTTTYGSNRFKLVLELNPAFAYKLLSFNGQKTSNRQVQLTWTTQSEGDNTQFTIERSNDGGKTFDDLGDMSSTGAGTYTFTDPDPLKGDNMYQLKTVDQFGNVTLSNNIVDEQFQDNGNDKGTSVTLYPNPAVSAISLTIVPKSQGKTSYVIQISNSAGLIVRSATTSDINWQSNISDLLVGTYLVQVTDRKDNSIVGQVKFVKL